jgi:putative membrane protein
MRMFMRMIAALVVTEGALISYGADDKKPVTDAEFVTKAASGGMFEVESSKLVAGGSPSPETKKFADMMIADHEKANKELAAIARKAGLALPTKLLDEHQKLLDKVKNASGMSQEAAYMAAQRTAHEEAVALFTNAGQNATQPDLKAFAEKTLPTLKKHLEHVKNHGKGDGHP